MKYESIIFIQGDDYAECEKVLYPESNTDDLSRGLLLGRPDEMALFRHLLQWDSGDPGETYTGPGDPWGSSDVVVWFTPEGHMAPVPVNDGYALTYHTRLSYAGLSRVRPDEKESTS